jgi:orotidine-5'-phosphate decarboxylase
MDFADRLVEAQKNKKSFAVLGVDPQLDTEDTPGLPRGFSLTQFCCEVVEAAADYVVAIKPQLAFFEARGLDGLRAFTEVLAMARKLNLITIADAKRGDIGSTSAAYAEAFLGDGDFACDAITVNPYLGSDAIAPFLTQVRNGRGIFVLVKTSNPSSAEIQDLTTIGGRPLWEMVAGKVRDWGGASIGKAGFSSVGAVIGATYPEHARRARELMPNAVILVPGYGAQGASSDDAVASARADGSGIIVNASRSLMYAYRAAPSLAIAQATHDAARAMRDDLKQALKRRVAS